MTPLEMLLCIFLVFLSGYLAASEIALFSLSKFQLRTLRENFRPTHRKIKRLLTDPSGLLITILVVNEVINVSLSSMITEYVAKSHFQAPSFFSGMPQWAYDTFLGILITTPILLLFCEITPKVIAIRINHVVASMTAGPLLIIYTVLKPIRLILKQVVKLASFQTRSKNLPGQSPGSHHHTNEAFLKESDFLLMLEEGHKEGSIQENEIALIRSVFELDNTPVSEIATPLSQVLSLSVNTTIKGALLAVKNQRYSRIPILTQNKKDVVGILYSKDLLRLRALSDISTLGVASIMRKPFFVNPSMNLNTIFRKFKQNKIHMAIVKDPNNDVVGVVTMSDVLDALFEDFFPDEDLEEDPHHKKIKNDKNIRTLTRGSN